jgi:hypothetical protein
MTIPKPEDLTRLSPTEDLHVALNLISSFQGTIQHADTKAGMLFAGQAVLIGTAVAAPLEVRPQWLAWLLTWGFLAGLLGTAWHLGAAIRPRLSGPYGSNRFSLRQVAGQVAPGADRPVRRHQQEAWQLAALLAGTAIEKHRRIQRSLPWAALTMLAFLGRAMVAGHL